MKFRIRILKDESIEVLGTVNEYYAMKTRTEFFGEERPTPLPIFLSCFIR